MVRVIYHNTNPYLLYCWYNSTHLGISKEFHEGCMNFYLVVVMLVQGKLASVAESAAVGSADFSRGIQAAILSTGFISSAPNGTIFG